MSDAHVDSDRARNESYALTQTNVGEGQSPLHDLESLVKERALSADFLINAGDLSNKADAAGLSFGWEQLTRIGGQLHAATLAVPGNHDVVTRRASLQQRSGVQGLRPDIPTLSPEDNAKFWELGWVVHETPVARFLLIDSTFAFPPFPDYAAEDSPEFQSYLVTLNRGAFPKSMQAEIEKALRGLEPKLNVAILHHHPQEHQYRSYLQDTYGPMERGSEFIEMLGSKPGLGRWFVIHGHKHLPQLVTAGADTSNGPFMLCAGSASAILWPPANSVARNQVHLVEMTDEDPNFRGSLRGSVRSWSWGFGMGWSEASGLGIEMPHLTGFGSADDFRISGQAVVDLLAKDARPHWSWADVVADVPSLPYMSPRDQKYLVDYLRDRKIQVLFSKNGTIQQLVKETK